MPLSPTPHLLLPCTLLLLETHPGESSDQWPPTCLDSSKCYTNTKDTQIYLADIFFEDPLTRKPLTRKLFLLRNTLRLRIKRRYVFPYSPSDTGRLRALQENTSKRAKRTPSRENLPAPRSSLGDFKLAVSRLNILTKMRYLEAKQLLRRLRQCWNS